MDGIFDWSAGRLVALAVDVAAFDSRSSDQGGVAVRPVVPAVVGVLLTVRQGAFRNVRAVVSLVAVAIDHTTAGQEPTLFLMVPGQDAAPVTDGRFVAWLVPGEDDPLHRDVYAAALTDRRPVPLSTGPAKRAGLDLSDGVAVWSEGELCESCPSDIVGFRIETGERLAIAATEADETAPAIWGRWVAWLSSDGRRQRLMLRDLNTNLAPETLAQADTAGNQVIGPPRVQSGLVVWLEATSESASGEETWDWRLLARRVAADEEPMVVAEGESTPYLPEYAVGGETVVYTAGEELHAVDIKTGQARALAGPVTDEFPPTTDGQYVFWGRVSPDQPDQVDILGFDLAAISLFNVTINTGTNRVPIAKEGTLAWQRAVGDVVEIHVARIADVLPSAPRPDPGTSSEEWVYFPQTGHYLANGFLAFWKRHGGLEVFGYPLTEEFSEWDPDSGKLRTVQYFERARLAYYPEHAGTTLEVQLGRVGVEEAATWGFLESRAFRSFLADSQDDPSCVFFPETGHHVCGAFLTYWQNHGLDLGDPGVSKRESLALFGYPISEVFTDPVSGLTVQYFERARFEWHPDDNDRYRVMLGRLGVTLLAEHGWRGQAQPAP